MKSKSNFKKYCVVSVLVLLFILLAGVLFNQCQAQDTPTGYTTHYGFRMWDEGMYPTDDSVNQNMIDIDDAIWGVDDRFPITSDQLGDTCISNAKIKDDAIKNEHLSDGCVQNAQIWDGSVNADKLDVWSVTTSKIYDGAVTDVKLGDTCISNTKIKDDAVRGVHIQDDAVTESKLGTWSVTSLKIYDGTIISNDLGDTCVSTAKVKDGAITNDKILANGLDASSMSTILFDTSSTSFIHPTQNGDQFKMTYLDNDFAPMSSSFRLNMAGDFDWTGGHSFADTTDFKDGISSNSTLIIDGDGFFKPVSSTDANAPINSIYYSTTQTALVYKDDVGTVNVLY